MKRHVLSVLVENHSGVLSRISGLFSRRGYNIDSLSVGETEDPKVSRMTIVADADEYTLEQIKKQLNKLVDVIKIIELKEENSIYRELAMIKIKASKANRAEIIEIANIFRAHIVDVSNDALIIEATGDQGKISALSNMLEPYGIKEVIRTGLTALQRGEKELKN
ncbi:acetolactate synthase small subunit [Cellulosilyticum sp. ST5]|uniref:Acetolactate synthase small subunit n=1 Tax=Cellulosilyticum lentocellum (strain ATCC 49066 / DSM 5427 / NCIMB 11756 / RHM5) TaxID=642492 RepID=F2JL15_CELLD|nr:MULTISPECIES: acetolactate synthase small subunit [Cellulosilyticum]ADZ84556.1 acetolactate synthase, small subunit [Cellulosilyticum lentocellum DSM 5427]QEH70009.1 acetolactate synthase small subunit [Cellulosilyticum sp. WCF-2]